jgi:CDP-diacylglycerol--glycerol-3-phosphate 3-phosphatidyltransferase/cardiolipin synthase
MRRGSLTVADIVSLSRLVLAGAFVHAGSPIARLAVVGLAAYSDWLDGWLARRAGASRYGAILDPAADRAFVVVVIGALVIEGALTVSQLVVLILRDIATTIGAVIVRATPSLRRAPLVARLSGKIVTVLQFLVIVAAISVPSMIPALLPIVAVATVISIADYGAAVWRSRRSA